MGDEPLEPSTRYAVVLGYRAALSALWGPEAVSRVMRALPPDAATSLGGSLPPDAWIPERHVVALSEAVWEGPCARDRVVFHLWIDRMLDQGFGRIRRVLLSLANPPMLLRRASEMWRDDHSHGTLGYVPLTLDAARITLKDHPFVGSPVQRDAFSEGLRYAMSLCHVRQVSAEEVSAPPGAVSVILRWS